MFSISKRYKYFDPLLEIWPSEKCWEAFFPTLHCSAGAWVRAKIHFAFRTLFNFLGWCVTSSTFKHGSATTAPSHIIRTKVKLLVIFLLKKFLIMKSAIFYKFVFL